MFVAFLGGDIGKTIWDMSLISFYVEGNLSVWFIPAILLLYLLFPFLYYAVENKTAVWIMGIIWVLSVAVAMSNVGG